MDSHNLFICILLLPYSILLSRASNKINNYKQKSCDHLMIVRIPFTVHTSKLISLVMIMVQITIIFALLVAVAFSEDESADKPHIVYVLVDDWGWANVGYHRNPPTREVDTPNTNSLVKDGLKLDQHYACLSVLLTIKIIFDDWKIPNPCE